MVNLVSESRLISGFQKSFLLCDSQLSRFVFFFSKPPPPVKRVQTCFSKVDSWSSHNILRRSSTQRERSFCVPQAFRSFIIIGVGASYITPFRSIWYYETKYFNEWSDPKFYSVSGFGRSSKNNNTNPIGSSPVEILDRLIFGGSTFRDRLKLSENPRSCAIFAK